MVLLSNLSYQDLSLYNCWKVDAELDGDSVLVPAIFDELGLVLPNNGEVWCKGLASFNNGRVFEGACMCRADSSDGPLLISVWNGERDVPIIMPPAPDFVLEQDGPVPFCQAFKLDVLDVFPISFNVVPEFVIEPRKRRILLQF